MADLIWKALVPSSRPPPDVTEFIMGIHFECMTALVTVIVPHARMNRFVPKWHERVIQDKLWHSKYSCGCE